MNGFQSDNRQGGRARRDKATQPLFNARPQVSDALEAWQEERSFKEEEQVYSPEQNIKPRITPQSFTPNEDIPQAPGVRPGMPDLARPDTLAARAPIAEPRMSAGAGAAYTPNEPDRGSAHTASPTSASLSPSFAAPSAPKELYTPNEPDPYAKAEQPSSPAYSSGQLGGFSPKELYTPNEPDSYAKAEQPGSPVYSSGQLGGFSPKELYTPNEPDSYAKAEQPSSPAYSSGQLGGFSPKELYTPNEPERSGEFDSYASSPEPRTPVQIAGTSREPSPASLQGGDFSAPQAAKSGIVYSPPSKRAPLAASDPYAREANARPDAMPEYEPPQNEADTDFSFTARYHRPAGESFDPSGNVQLPEEPAFAPPPRFAAQAAFPYEELPLEPDDDDPSEFSPQVQVYQPRAVSWEENGQPASSDFPARAYEVESRDIGNQNSKRKKMSIGKRLGIAALALVMLGAALYIGYTVLLGESAKQEIAKLLGMDSAQPETFATVATTGTMPVSNKGYDPSPAITMKEAAGKGIAAVSGTLDMDAYAVTKSHVVTRVQTGEKTYDYYLFTADKGQLLGYFEGLSDKGVLVQLNEIFFVEQEPYFVDGQGKALFDIHRYAQYVGDNPAFSPFENGWAIINDAEGMKFNYINQAGELLSNLWFAKVFPFYGDYTVAYVDTGNVAATGSRYALYIVSASGTAERWRESADMLDVKAAAADIALLADGSMVALSNPNQVIAQVDHVSIYVDCGAVVARDSATGKYGLFVEGAQQYDFVYDTISPVPCDIQWKQLQGDGFTLSAVTNIPYPLPLSHYFALQKEGVEEKVALATRSIYAVTLR